MTAPLASKRKRRNQQSGRLAKVNELYSGQDVLRLYGVCPNTLTNWIKSGLVVIEGTPRLFLGADLNAFHKRRRIVSSKPSANHEAYCPGCRKPHSLLEGDLNVQKLSTGNFRVFRLCPEGAGSANKWVSAAELALLQQLRESNPGPKTPD